MALDGRGFTICGEAATAAAAIELADSTQPDLCLLDVRMPGNGISAAAEIARRCPDTVIVMLTVTEDEDDVLNALRAGAQGYLLKDTPARRLPEVLRAVIEGEAALPRRLVARLIAEFRTKRPRRGSSGYRALGVELTTREWDILELLRRGKPTNAIAAELGVAPVTVRSHVSALLRKLQVETREDLLRLFDDAER